jgi:hypothetical protein
MGDTDVSFRIVMSYTGYDVQNSTATADELLQG